MSVATQVENELLRGALESARDTELLLLERGARRRAGEAFTSLFGAASAVVVSDETIFSIAGRDVHDALRQAGQACHEPVVLPAQGLYAEYSFVDQLCQRLQAIDAVPIAVGAGTINDLVKLAAHRCGRKYLTVATAASMDGYTAYGASITYKGSKQTFDCPAPKGVVADLDVIAAAPEGMNASGFADLAAKCPAGADWLLAEFLGVEAINRHAWEAVQSQLRFWMDNPAGVRQRKLESLRRLTVALMMTGFAMQSALSSRPASGAEHQFSHLWDMEHHTHAGAAPSHGFKVGIGSLASIALYETLFREALSLMDIEAIVAAWPDAERNEQEIAALFSHDELAAKAREESGVKHVSRDVLRNQLVKLSRGWPELRDRLREQLVSFAELRDMLCEAGAAYMPEQIGISRDRLRRSYRQAYHIRRRFTVLDVARRAGLMDAALEQIFSSDRGQFA
ncbi:MAG: sn-glycerol-1-phosphate dehydrogenase [Pirellulales bacterium]|nr:sn-glycerol-1-phosphate dehydrogenase [Pirellulales bacterium]